MKSLFRLVFSQNTVLVPDYDNLQRLYYLEGKHVPTSPVPNLTFIAPKAGYIRSIACNTDISYWICNNGVQAAHKCNATQSSNIFFPVNKGDKIQVIVFAAGSMQHDVSSIRVEFIPSKATDISSI